MDFLKDSIYLLYNSSPLSTISLSLIIILMLIKQKRNVDSINNNHLHEITETLKRIEGQLDKLDKIEIGIEIIKSKLNNG